MAVKVMSKYGTEVTLLNPSEKGGKYADELRNNVRITNDGHLKLGEDNKPQYLTKEQRAYRAGYLGSQKDSANCYNSKLGKAALETVRAYTSNINAGKEVEPSKAKKEKKSK